MVKAPCLNPTKLKSQLRQADLRYTFIPVLIMCHGEGYRGGNLSLMLCMVGNHFFLGFIDVAEYSLSSSIKLRRKNKRSLIAFIMKALD